MVQKCSKWKKNTGMKLEVVIWRLVSGYEWAISFIHQLWFKSKSQQAFIPASSSQPILQKNPAETSVDPTAIERDEPPLSWYSYLLASQAWWNKTANQFDCCWYGLNPYIDMFLWLTAFCLGFRHPRVSTDPTLHGFLGFSAAFRDNVVGRVGAQEFHKVCCGQQEEDLTSLDWWDPLQVT